MDYSTVTTDSDALHGSSPWGSSSPRASRSTFPQEVQNASNERDQVTGQSPFLTQNEVQPPSSSLPTGEPQQDGPRSDQIVSPYAGAVNQTPHPHQHPQQTKPNSKQQNIRSRPVPAYTLQAKVTALERSGRKDPIIKFDVHTNIPKFRTTQFRDVRRTHTEFQKLSEHLISSNPEAIVPAVPPNLTSAGAGTDEDELRIKNSMQRWLTYVCGNDVLMRDDEMILFIESDAGYSPLIKMKQPATGVRRKVLKQFSPPPDDTPELHEARPIVKLFYLGSLDSAQKMDKLVKSRRALGLAENTLGEKLSQMHVQELHPGLSYAYRKLGRVIQQCGDYHSAQGTAEATTFGDPLNYHSSDAFIVKETLTNRHILLRELLQSEQNRKQKESNVTRLKSSSNVRRDKVDEAISGLDEASSQENYLKNKTQRVTTNLLAEKRKWFERTSNDMLTSVREYVLRQIDSERRTLSTLESVRPDIRSIDASGGLSRLGRENHPPGGIRRISLASSQTAKGDSWSGVPRSRDTLTRSLSGTTAGGTTGGYGSSSIHQDEVINGGGDEQAKSSPTGRPRSTTGHASLSSVKEDEDDDRVDAKNAASRLAQSTF